MAEEVCIAGGSHPSTRSWVVTLAILTDYLCHLIYILTPI